MSPALSTVQTFCNRYQLNPPRQSRQPSKSSDNSLATGKVLASFPMDKAKALARRWQWTRLKYQSKAESLKSCYSQFSKEKHTLDNQALLNQTHFFRRSSIRKTQPHRLTLWARLSKDPWTPDWTISTGLCHPSRGRSTAVFRKQQCNLESKGDRGGLVVTQ